MSKPLIQIDHPVHLPNFGVAIDSGAHSLYVQLLAGVTGKSGAKGDWSRKNASYEYLETDRFKKYLNRYIEYLCEHQDSYKFCVSLDIIGSGYHSWEVLKYMESFGLKVMPVYHFGEDIKWIKKMVEEYDYIGVGGIGQDISKEKWLPFANNAFEVICDGKGEKHGFGKPLVKVHGFAMGSADMMKRYPFFSCDQSTWTYMARCGTILLPKWNLKRNPETQDMEPQDFNYMVSPQAIPTSPRRLDVKRHIAHMASKSPTALAMTEKFLEWNGTSVQEVQDSYQPRDVLNIRWFKNLEVGIKKHYANHFEYEDGGNIYMAGTPSSGSTNLGKFICMLDRLHHTPGGEFIKEIDFLTSFWYASFDEHCRRITELNNAKGDLRELIPVVTDTPVIQPEGVSTAVKVSKPNLKKKRLNAGRTIAKVTATVNIEFDMTVPKNNVGECNLEGVAKGILDRTLNKSVGKEFNSVDLIDIETNLEVCTDPLPEKKPDVNEDFFR